MPARFLSHIPSRVRVLTHLVFWAGVLAFYTLYFGQRQDNYNQSLLFVGALLPITIAATYFLNYWLIPRYLLARRYFFFGLYFIYALLFTLYLELLLVLILYINVAQYQAMFVKPGLVDVMEVIVGMYLVVFLAAAIHLLKRWYAMQTLNAQIERTRMEVELKLKDAELQLLRSQIHPHFLFNTLNNLYGLSLTKSEHVPDVVLRISSILDYMLYRGDAERVPLSDEIAHIRNYLALERLRYDERTKITVDVAGEVDGQRIAPLLLIPFVENSVKHGPGASSEPGWIAIRIAIDEGALHFAIENSTPERASAPTRPDGIGLQNVRRRLELLYPDAHRLTIADEPRRFRVELTLELDA
ncbi:MAG: histidine kinase [Rhodothermales bacterium]